MPRSSVRVVDRGAARLLAAARALSDRRQVAEVGVLGEDAERPYGEGEITVAMVATWAEFGLGQPMRSWLRGWADEDGPAIEERIRLETRAVLEGKRTQREALDRIGVWAVGRIRERIARGIDPPNAESTIARKGSSVPLIDTGQLRSSIANRTVDE